MMRENNSILIEEEINTIENTGPFDKKGCDIDARTYVSNVSH
jgi:hypothetical protein